MTERGVFDANGEPVIDRRVLTRREDDLRDDALDPAHCSYPSSTAGSVWKHRGKIAVAIGLVSTLAGCVAGYLGRADDLNDVRARLARDSARTTALESDVGRLERNESLKMLMLCSLTRRIDPLGVPVECGTLARHP